MSSQIEERATPDINKIATASSKADKDHLQRAVCLVELAAAAAAFCNTLSGIPRAGCLRPKPALAQAAVQHPK